MGANGHHELRRGFNGTVCNDSIRPLDYFGDVDPWTAWAYKPRMISLLLTGTCLLM
jgi:phosphatidylserine synthase 2